MMSIYLEYSLDNITKPVEIFKTNVLDTQRTILKKMYVSFIVPCSFGKYCSSHDTLEHTSCNYRHVYITKLWL